MFSIKNSCLAAVAVLGLFFVSSASAEEVDDMACASEESLRTSIVEWLQEDDESGEIIHPACTLLPSGYKPLVIRVIGTAIGDCVSSFCAVRIEEAIHDGRLYYIARDWMEQHDPDALEEAQIEYEPSLPVGIPCELFDCVMQGTIETANQ